MEGLGRSLPLRLENAVAWREPVIDPRLRRQADDVAYFPEEEESVGPAGVDRRGLEAPSPRRRKPPPTPASRKRPAPVARSPEALGLCVPALVPEVAVDDFRTKLRVVTPTQFRDLQHPDGDDEEQDPEDEEEVEEEDSKMRRTRLRSNASRGSASTDVGPKELPSLPRSPSTPSTPRTQPESAVLPEGQFRKISYRGSRYHADGLSKDYIDNSVASFDTSKTTEFVEYDMDDEDVAWLELINERRVGRRLKPIRPESFEAAIDKLEKEGFVLGVALGASPATPYDDDAVCSICMSGECDNSNAILFCDACNVPVHQECYGVPFVPEGQWLCRRCTIAPSQSNISCALCPLIGGPLKQTEDGRKWVHVQCALWVPEINFGSLQLREPIFGLKTVDKQRYKLTCYLCGRKNAGACIQCYRKNCYTAFHVTCAQEAGLCLHLGAELEGESSTLEAYCHCHTPRDCDPALVRTRSDGTLSKDRTQIKKRVLQLLGQTGSGSGGPKNPALLVPAVPPSVLASVLDEHHVQEAEEFGQLVRQFWFLKRKARRGVPLLRSLQGNTNSVLSQRAAQLQTERKKFHYIRRILEKTRMLVGQVVRREKLKTDYLIADTDFFTAHTAPTRCVLDLTLAALRRKDSEAVFHEPVNVEEYTNYLELVDTPMDFRTMENKLQEGAYDHDTPAFVSDFQRTCENAMAFNSEGTWWHDYAWDMYHAGNAVLEHAAEHLGTLPVDPTTGMLDMCGPERREPPLATGLDVVYNFSSGLIEYVRDSLAADAFSIAKPKGASTSDARSDNVQSAAPANAPKNDVVSAELTGRDAQEQSEGGASMADDGVGTSTEVLDGVTMLSIEITDEGGSALGSGIADAGVLSASAKVTGVGEGVDSTVVTARATVTPADLAPPEGEDLFEFNILMEMLHSRKGVTKDGKKKPGLRASRLKTLGAILYSYRAGRLDDIPERWKKAAGLAVKQQPKQKAAPIEKVAETINAFYAHQPCWAKANGFPWYPAQLVDPRAEASDSTTAAPPKSVILAGPPKSEWAPLTATRASEKVAAGQYLVNFFDKNRSWAWVPKSKVVAMFESDAADEKMLKDPKKSSKRVEVRAAFTEAQAAHRRRRSQLKARKH